MSESVIEAAGLVVRHGARDALGPLDLTVHQGDFWGIVGPNGAGKTTLLHALSGLVAPSSGKLSVCGWTAGTPRSQSFRQAVAVLFQQHDYLPEVPLTVEDVICFGRAACGRLGRRWQDADSTAVNAAAEALGLSTFRKRLYRELSGGERRKVQLARLLAQQSGLLLMDEPVAGLDMDWQARLTALTGELRRRFGKTVLFVTHDLAHLPSCCTHLLLLNHGRVHAIGRPSEVLNSETLSSLYNCPIRIETRADWFAAYAVQEAKQ
jgi:iron complex transport system ATP-binding protein